MPCRASMGGATEQPCRANDCPRPERAANRARTHSQRCDRVGWSRQCCWRDRATLPRHGVSKSRKDCIFDLVVWQIPLVAPFPLARQRRIVAPSLLARQTLSAAPCFPTTQKGLHFACGGARAQFCRATRNGAISTEFGHLTTLVLCLAAPSRCCLLLLLLAAACFSCCCMLASAAAQCYSCCMEFIMKGSVGRRYKLQCIITSILSITT